jgi:hypothetical protein
MHDLAHKGWFITFIWVYKCTEYDEILDSRRVSNFQTTSKKVSVGHKEQSHKKFTGRSFVSAEHPLLVY